MAQGASCEAIVSAPWDEFRELFDAKRQSLKWNRASYLSIEQQDRHRRKSDLPLKHYDIAILKHTLEDEKSGRKIDCRVLFVKSTADEKAAASPHYARNLTNIGTVPISDLRGLQFCLRGRRGRC